MVSIPVDYGKVVRISATAHCRFQTAARIIGLPETPLSFKTLAAFAIGTSLESVIIRALQGEGLKVNFCGLNQLTVSIPLTARGWMWVGHPDGLILPCNRPITTLDMPSAIKNIILAELAAGYLMLLEIKTMNPNSFGTFFLHGLSGDPFLASYIYQIHGYFEGLAVSGKRAIQNLGLPPRKCLVVGMDVDSKRRHYEIVERDKATIQEAKEWVNGLAQSLASGVMPAPDYSGSDLQCRMCSVSVHCPAAQHIRSSRQVSSAILEADLARLNDLAALYAEYGIQIDAMESARKGVKAEVEEVLGDIPRVETDEWIVSRAQVKGRASLDRKAVEERYMEMAEDLPMTYGQPYSRLTVTPLGKDPENASL